MILQYKLTGAFSSDWLNFHSLQVHNSYNKTCNRKQVKKGINMQKETFKYLT